MKPGSIVRFRNRDWVLLPGDREVFRLRPLVGLSDDVVAVHKQLADILAFSLPGEQLKPSQFPLPSWQKVSDAASAHLLWQAARLTLREGAAPIRSLGRISIRPRSYQFVPLLMALRLDPVRIFIADDVGVGKTIEALLIARELWDRGEIERLAVLCPPYLCDQWEKELREKFNFDPVLVRSSSVSMLERRTPPGKTIYQHFPVQVISMDWVKSDRNRNAFLLHCPELVIVDEVHGAAEASSRNTSQQQRHRLLQEIAADERRHLILLTATPHSGISEAFRSLLGLLKPKFKEWDTAKLNEGQRQELAKHFIQRTRADITKDWESAQCFPQREAVDESYILSQSYRELFEETFRFCTEIVTSGQKLDQRRRRVRYWGALALLRCVMSSPAAAFEALQKRRESLRNFGEQADEEPDFAPYVFEATQDTTDDETPIPPIDETETTLPEPDQRRLRRLARMAEGLRGPHQDTKLATCIRVVKNLLKEGSHPIIWCRYVATADYVGEYLRRELPAQSQVLVITGRMGDDERRVKIAEISLDQPRVLVATDCLSEGINLQEKFNAVLHYDLPWNPNRLEQREGRVDRFGQTSPSVKVVRFYGRNNPVDGAVIKVLLEKAKEIYRTLGTHVPVPEEAETFMEAVFNTLFGRQKARDSGEEQLLLFQDELIDEFHRRWEDDAKREHANRTRFAQRAIKPDEVQKELEAVDAVLGDPQAVQEFVLNAAQRLGASISPDPRNPQVYRVDLSDRGKQSWPEVIRLELPETKEAIWRISFVSPTPQGAEYIGRNHRFVTALARYLLEQALSEQNGACAARCGVIRTTAVSLLTNLYLLRIRYLLEIPEKNPMLAEEVIVLGHISGAGKEEAWLAPDEALSLLATALPSSNISLAEKQELLHTALQGLGDWLTLGEAWGTEHPIQKQMRDQIITRAEKLEEAHKRIRKAISLRIRELKVQPQFPPDLLGLIVLQPEVKP